MYPTSTQKKLWTFSSVGQLNELRVEQNTKFIAEHGGSIAAEYHLEFFLTPEEERLLLKQYEIYLADFCRRFDPPMPKCVVSTAFQYFKRFYLNNSPMNYHPKEILATVVYLACKVEEFNVSIGQFVSNIKGDRSKATDIILWNELLLMRQLKYYLTVHNPLRPIEGFLIDIKTRSSMQNPERLRPHIDGFIDVSFFTDSCLLYAPSKIALAAVLHAASREEENLDNYVTDYLFKSAREKLPSLIESVRKIRFMVKEYKVPNKDRVRKIEKKLESCRNHANNPDSQVFKDRIKQMQLEESESDFLDESTSFHIAEASAEGSVLNMST